MAAVTSGVGKNSLLFKIYASRFQESIHSL